MSEEQSKQPESEQPKPSITPPPVSESVSSQAKVELQQFIQLLQAGWQRAQPVLKAQSIKTLKLTVQLLNTVLAKLEAEPPTSSAPPPSQVSVTPRPTPSFTPAAQSPDQPAPVSSTQVQPSVETGSTSGDVPSSQPIAPVSSPKFSLEELRPLLGRLQVFWQAALKQIRPRLPASMQNLSDQALTGIVAAGLVVLLWFTSGLFSGGAKSPEIAKVPTSQRQVPKNLTAPAELSAPEEVKPVESSPPAAPSVAPPAVWEITPEQARLNQIQNQFVAVTDQYSSGLLESIKANTPNHRLIVKVGSGWYSLSHAQQNQLADAVLHQAQSLDFSQLEITDSQGALLARSPVVGSDMVILKRTS